MPQQERQLLVNLVQRDLILPQEQEVALNVKQENIKVHLVNLLVPIVNKVLIQLVEHRNVRIVLMNVRPNAE